MANDLVNVRDELRFEHVSVGVRATQVGEYIAAAGFDLRLFCFHEKSPFFAIGSCHAIRWRSPTLLERLRGTPVRLRFRLRYARL